MYLAFETQYLEVKRGPRYVHFLETVIFHGQEEEFAEDSEQLFNFLVQRNWVSSSVKLFVLSEVRSFGEI